MTEETKGTARRFVDGPEFCAPAADAFKSDIIRRLRRIEGQVRGIQRMLEQGRECNDVITQLMAIRSGVDQVSLQIVDLHIDRCLFPEIAVDPATRTELSRSLRLLSRFAASVPSAAESDPA